MKKIIKFIFLLFLSFSNISTAIFIYPIIYFILGLNSESMKWYYFGIIFSIYELGKFFGLFLWDFFSNKLSKIILILISLSFLFIINLSYMFSFNLYHILLIRFLSGFFNNIGKFSKEISIQLGFKGNLQIVIFFISIISTFIAIFIPSLICYRIITKNGNNANHIKEIYQITIFLSINNLLSIIFCLILFYKKIICKTNGKFIPMNNLEKSSDFSRNNQKENIKIPQSTTDSNRTSELKHNKKTLNLKKKNKIIDNQNSGRINIKSYEEKKFTNRTDIVKKTEEQSKLGKRSSLNLFTKKQNGDNYGKEIMNQVLKVTYRVRHKHKTNESDDLKNNQRKKKYAFIHILIEISDTLSLIWILIALYLEYKGNCLYISIVYSCIRLIGEIVAFPINTFIIKNASYYSQYQSKKISKNIMIVNILLFFITILSNSFIFLYYYFFQNKKIMIFLLFLFTLIRNITSIINVKIISVQCFNLHNINMISLRKYRQYIGYVVKACVFMIGSFGYHLINNLPLNVSKIFNFNKLPTLVFILYFIIFPSFINLILIIMFKFFM